MGSLNILPVLVSFQTRKCENRMVDPTAPANSKKSLKDRFGHCKKTDQVVKKKIFHKDKTKKCARPLLNITIVLYLRPHSL